MPRKEIHYFLNDASGRNEVSEDTVNKIMSRRYKDGTKPMLKLTTDTTYTIQVINSFRMINEVVYDLTFQHEKNA